MQLDHCCVRPSFLLESLPQWRQVRFQSRWTSFLVPAESYGFLQRSWSGGRKPYLKRERESGTLSFNMKRRCKVLICVAKNISIVIPADGHRTLDVSLTKKSGTVITSSTAQGGGGSFKNRKPIGEIVVNHGWQGEATDGSIDLSHSFSLVCSLSLIIYQPTYLPTDLSIYFSIYLSISLSSVCLSVCLSVYPSIYLSIHPSMYPSIPPSIYLSLSLISLSLSSVYLSI